MARTCGCEVREISNLQFSQFIERILSKSRLQPSNVKSLLFQKPSRLWAQNCLESCPDDLISNLTSCVPCSRGHTHLCVRRALSEFASEWNGANGVEHTPRSYIEILWPENGSIVQTEGSLCTGDMIQCHPNHLFRGPRSKWTKGFVLSE